MSLALPLVRPERGLVAAVRGFTPNWFTVSMGTGGFALALRAAAPFLGADGIAEALWGLDAAIFAALVLVYAGQWLLFPHEARRALDHPVQAMFLGAVPMALATVVNGLIAYAPATLPWATALWGLDAALSVGSGLAAPFLMFTRHDHRLERMTAVWLIPLVAAEVAATTAAALAPHLDPERAFQMVLAGYVLWAFSVPAALGVLALLFLRLALHRLPEREFGASCWLALGPLGTGALGLIALGADAPAAFAAHGLASVGEAARGLGLVGGLMLWGYGLWWFGLAVLATLRYLRQGLPFNMGWWAFTFPVAVYTLATFALAQATSVEAFAVFGEMLCLGLAFAWTLVSAMTLALLAG